MKNQYISRCCLLYHHIQDWRRIHTFPCLGSGNGWSPVTITWTNADFVMDIGGQTLVKFEVNNTDLDKCIWKHCLQNVRLFLKALTC